MTPSQQANPDDGLVYILSHPSMPGLYKIGLTRASVADRIKTLRSTSIPFDFECIFFIRSDHALQLERFIHRNLKSNRVSSSREFFSFAGNQLAIDSINSIAAKFKPRKYTGKEVVKLKIEREKDSASKEAKSMGFKSLKEVSGICTVSCATLGNWFKHNHIAFHVMLLGCLVIKESNNNK